MIDAFGISKDWWEEPPKKEHHVSTGAKVAGGTAAGLGVGAGAVLLATHGKAGKTLVETITRTKKVKVKAKAPKAPSTAPGPTHPHGRAPIAVPGTRAIGGKPAPVPQRNLPALPAGKKLLAIEGRKHSHTEFDAPRWVEEAKTTAPAPGRASTKDRPVGPNVPKTPKKVLRRRQRRDKIRGNQAKFSAKADRAAQSKTANEEDINNLAKGRPAPIMFDGTRADMPSNHMEVRGEPVKVVGTPHSQVKHGTVNGDAPEPKGQSKWIRFYKRDADIIAKRIMMDMQDDIFKASITGEQGDKRNTKYALAGAGGYVTGSAIGHSVSARMAGTTYSKHRDQVQRKTQKHWDKEPERLRRKRAKQPAKRVDVPQAAENLFHLKNKEVTIRDKHGKKIPDSAYHEPSIKQILRVQRKVDSEVKGSRAVRTGGWVGAGAGLAAGAGAVYAYRHRKVSKSNKDHGVDWKSGALLGAAAGGAAGNIVGVPAAGMAAAMSGKKSSSKAFTRSLIRFNKSPIVLAPVALGAGLGALGGKGAKELRDKEHVKKSESPAMLDILAARRSADPIAKAIVPKKIVLPKPVQTKLWSAADDESKAKAIATQKQRYAMRRTA